MRAGLYRRTSFGVALGLAAALVFALAGTALAGRGGNGDPPPGLERAIAAQEAHTDALLARAGVVGTAVGLGQDGNPAVLVLTETPGVSGIPSRLDGVPVVVQVTGRFTALHHRPGHSGGPGGSGDPTPTPTPTSSIDPTAKFPWPVPIGVSTGHPDITAGTIGARLTDGAKVYALSNNHVYANGNNATLGDNVLQPGPYDGGVDPDDAIGTLVAYMPIVFSSGANNRVDAAIALTTVGQVGNETPSDGYGKPSATLATAQLEQPVRKYGRTTGHTTGTVTGLNAIVTVCYDGRGARCFRSARFIDQIIISPGSFSAGGDSGSLIVTNDGTNRPVGLLFAGNSSYTIANPIGDVLSELSAQLGSDLSIDAS